MGDIAAEMGQIVEYAARLDHRIIGEQPTANSNGASEREILLQTPKGATYSVLFVGGADYAVLKFEFSAVDRLQNSMSEEEFRSYLDTELARNLSDYSDAYRAAAAKLEHEYGDTLDDLRDALRDELDSKHCRSILVTTPADTLSGFRLTRNIFPTEDGFTLPEYDNTVRNVAHVWSQGLTFLTDHVDFAASQTDSKPIEAGDQEIEFKGFR